MGIICFGDRIPGSSNNDFFVSYCVTDFPGGILSGPYKDRLSAEYEMSDLLTFNEVNNIKIVTREELMKSGDENVD